MAAREIFEQHGAAAPKFIGLRLCEMGDGADPNEIVRWIGIQMRVQASLGGVQ